MRYLTSSISKHLTDTNLLHYFNTNFPQPLPWPIWTLFSNSVSCVVSALQHRPSPRASLFQIYISANTHWTIWSDFCVNVVLYPLLLLYKDPIPLLVTSLVDYRCGDISASRNNVHPRMVEDALLSIGQALAAI